MGPDPKKEHDGPMVGFKVHSSFYVRRQECLTTGINKQNKTGSHASSRCAFVVDAEALRRSAIACMTRVASGAKSFSSGAKCCISYPVKSIVAPQYPAI